MTIFFNPAFMASAFGHFAVDIINGQRSVLFTYLSVSMGLSNSQLGIFSTAYILVAAIMQPIFGWVTDKYGPRWVIPLGIFWMGGFFTAGILTPGIPGLIMFIIGSVGSGAFHPAGTAQATLFGKEVLEGRETTTASIFFLFGQIGHFMGPLLAGLILEDMGVTGILWIVAFTVPVGLYSLRVFGPKANQAIVEKAKIESVAGAKTALWMVVIFALMAAFQSWSQANMMVYLPKYLSELGKTPSQYGLLTSLFMGGSAIGNLLGGYLGDKLGRRLVASVALFLAAIPIGLISILGWTSWLYLLIPLAGAFTGATHSIIVVLAQRIIPSGMAMASGLILGFMFGAGSLGSMLSGFFADLWGFPVMFGITAGLVLLASIFSLSLKYLDPAPVEAGA
jgi:FSR family fosmidomycin resistance protein-like MFS transporter